MALFGNDSALGRINDLIKIGVVSSINPTKLTARVSFDDDDGVVSYDLPILQRNTDLTKDFHSVTVGEDVLCVFLPSGPESGFVIGSFYAGEVMPPESAQKRRTTIFEDGTIVRYDMDAHELTVQIGETTIVANRSRVAESAPEQISLSSTTISVSGSDVVNIEGGSAVNISAPVVNLTMGGSTMKFSGGGATLKTSTLTVDGKIECTGDVVAGGVSLMSHTHPGDSGGSTGAPQ